jgi:hypothetical protein
MSRRFDFELNMVVSYGLYHFNMSYRRWTKKNRLTGLVRRVCDLLYFTRKRTNQTIWPGFFCLRALSRYSVGACVRSFQPQSVLRGSLTATSRFVKVQIQPG